MGKDMKDASAKEIKVNVEIFGNTYTLKGKGSSESVERIARFVDGKMRDISSKASVATSEKIAILTALNIAEEYFALKDEHSALREDLDAGLDDLNDRIESSLK